MADGNGVGIATLAITQGYAQFNVFLPRLSDVRRAAPGDDVAADVHIGVLAASIGTLGVGFIASSLSGSKLPATVSFVVCVLMASIYESVLHARTEGTVK